MPGIQQASSHFLVCRWRFWQLGIRKALDPLQAAWDAFSQPVPASCGQLLTQLLLCACLAVAAAELVCHWLVSSWLYPSGPLGIIATVCGHLVFLGLGLVPPVRCLFALSVPTLGTEQGRRLLLSYSSATLAVAVVPNVLANMGAAGQVLRCVTEGSLDSLLNTTHQLRNASTALGPTSRSSSRGLTFESQGNGSAFRLHMLRVTQGVLEDFSALESLARAAALGTQRVVTGMFMLGLLVESAWYLHRYLTDLRFDNIYETPQLTRQLAQAQATHLVAPPPPWLLGIARPKLSREELLGCLLRLGLLSLLLVVTAVAVATDHMAFLLAQAAVDWAQKLPVVPVTLMVKYDVSAGRGDDLGHINLPSLKHSAKRSLSVIMVTPVRCFLIGKSVNCVPASVTFGLPGGGGHLRTHFADEGRELGLRSPGLAGRGGQCQSPRLTAPSLLSRRPTPRGLLPLATSRTARRHAAEEQEAAGSLDLSPSVSTSIMTIVVTYFPHENVQGDIERERQLAKGCAPVRPGSRRWPFQASRWSGASRAPPDPPVGGRLCIRQELIQMLQGRLIYKPLIALDLFIVT
uniref:Osteoclast stimulatory transmembrane protein n=1 Tax=Spermophilus dauricus TaxID=99837 RepID=A0A8C9PC02_SPEDA